MKTVAKILSGFSIKIIVLLMVVVNPVIGQTSLKVVDSLIAGLSVKEQIDKLHEYTNEMRQIDIQLARMASIKALELTMNVGDDRLHARSLLNVGRIYLRTGVADSAELMYNQAETLFQAADDWSGLADIKLNQGTLLLNTAEYEKALQLFQKALEYAEPLSDTLQILTCRQNIAITHHYMGNIEHAKNFYLTILDGGYRAKYPEILLNTMVNMGYLMEQLDEYPAAISYYKSALAIADSLGNLYRKANILNNLGSAYIWSGKNQDALEVLGESFYINEILENQQGKASVLSKIGAVYELEGNLQRANELYIQALQISEEIGDRRNVAIILAYMGENLMKQGHYKHALNYFRKSLQITDKHQLIAETAEVYRWMTFVHSMTGDIDSAYEYSEKFSRLRNQLDLEIVLPETTLQEESATALETENTQLNDYIFKFIMPIISLLIISGLVMILFLLMAFIIINRQRRKKFYRQNREYW